MSTAIISADLIRWFDQIDLGHRTEIPKNAPTGVAARSSASAEDLPDAGFVGQAPIRRMGACTRWADGLNLDGCNRPSYANASVKWVAAVLRALALLMFVLATSAAAQSPSSQPNYRTIITYNGDVCISTPGYDLMPNGQFIFKRGGMRFDGAGYFWSPAVRDNIVRRNQIGTRIVGTTNQYWPPLVPNSTPAATPTWKPTTPWLPANPYFGTGMHTVARSHADSSNARAVPNKQHRTQLVRCPNGSYAIFCR